MAERLRYALVGCGEIAVRTSEAILESDVAEVVCCMDVKESMAQDLADRHEARCTTDYDDVLADDRVQAVILSTPHYLHEPQTVAAAQAGKHVIVEKPIACDLRQADAMISATEKAGVKLDVLYPRRFAFQTETARRLVRGGAIGEVSAVHFHGMSQKPETYWNTGWSGRVKTDWRTSLEKSGGGVTIMNLSHNIDAMNYILDMKPMHIYAECDNLRTPISEVEDFLSFVMRLEGGAIVSLNASSAAPGDETLGDRIYGEKGQIVMRWKDFRVYVTEPWEDLQPGEWNELSEPEGYVSGRRRHVDGFAGAVMDGGDVPVSGREARRALEIVRGAYISGKAGRVVKFPVAEP